MATTDIVIPATEAERAVFIGNVGSVLAGSKDCRFVDAAGNERDVAFLNVAVDATVRCRAAGQADNEAKDFYFVKGGWHVQKACKFFYGGTTASTLMKVKGIHDRG